MVVDREASGNAGEMKCHVLHLTRPLGTHASTGCLPKAARASTARASREARTEVCTTHQKKSSSLPSGTPQKLLAHVLQHVDQVGQLRAREARRDAGHVGLEVQEVLV